MCGIAGLVLPRRKPFEGPVAETVVKAMSDSISHRGPDGDGVWRDPEGRCVLGQKRLAIIDTSDAGLQPFVSGDGRWWITFNGEIYNFPALRLQLEQAGVHLRGRTDTEVLLEGIALHGVDWISRLDGMFAFAAFDTRSGETLIARDPFGEKPLYYMDLPGKGLAFASELQAIEKVPGFDGTVDLDAMAELLTFQYIGAPRTIYAAVKKLPPGCWMRISADGESEIQRYFRFDPGHDLFQGRSMASLADELEDILVRSLQGRMIADVPLGAFLSGGVDSSTVCALVRRRLDAPLKSFSIGFKGAPESEHETARIFAKHLGTEHYEEIVEPNSADFLLGVGKVLDEPNGDSSCLPTYMLSQFCRKHVTVAISGDGGDEMFGGYGRYFATLADQQLHDEGRLPRWQPGQTYYGNRILVAHEPHLQELLGFVPEGFSRHINGLRADLDLARPGLLAAMRRQDVDNYLPGAVIPKVDRMSMQHSLEVRTPFLNVELARFAERLSDDMMIRNGRGKLVLKEIAYRYLPRELIDLPKQGFALPMTDWARNALLGTAGNLLESDDSRLAAAFGREGIERFFQRQRAEGSFSAYQVWNVATLESWLRHHPAVLPDVSERQVRSRAVAEPSPMVHPIRGGLFVVGTISAQDLSDEIDAPVKIPSCVTNYVLRAAEEPGLRPLEGELQSVPFADLSQPLSVSDTTRLQRLNGAIVVMLDREAILKLDHAAISTLRSLGVRRIAYADPFTDEVMCEIDFRNDRSGRLSRLLKLWRERIGVFSNRRLAKRLMKSQPLHFGPGHQLYSGHLPAIRHAPNQELVGEYAVFEGALQLPPLRCSHAMITEEGGGRYSIFDQNAIFSETAPERRFRAPYWIVPVTDETRPLLDMTYRTISAEASVPDNPDAVARFFQPGDGAGFALKPGAHIAVCTHALPPGGAERQWLYLAQGLKAQGYRVTFITYSSLKGSNGHYLPQLAASGIAHYDASDVSTLDVIARFPDIAGLGDLERLVGPSARSSFFRASAALYAVKPDVVMAQLDEPNIVFAAAARGLGIERIVTSFRNYNPTNFDYIYQPTLLPAYQMTARSGALRFTGNFKGAVDDYADWIGIDRDRATTIPNAIDPAMFSDVAPNARAALRAEIDAPPDAPLVLGVFRLSAEKGPFDFIEVARHVIDTVPAARFVIAGVGAMRPVLQERISKLGLGGNVRLLGRRDDVPNLLAGADVMLLTSHREGMPNVVLEAQTAGLPVVATRAGASPQIIDDGVTGHVCEIGDIDALAFHIIDLLKAPELARRMGQAAKSRSGDEHSKDKLAERYIAALV